MMKTFYLSLCIRYVFIVHKICICRLHNKYNYLLYHVCARCMCLPRIHSKQNIFLNTKISIVLVLIYLLLDILLVLIYLLHWYLTDTYLLITWYVTGAYLLTHEGLSCSRWSVIPCVISLVAGLCASWTWWRLSSIIYMLASVISTTSLYVF